MGDTKPAGGTFITGSPCGCDIYLPDGFSAWCPHGTYLRTPGSPLTPPTSSGQAEPAADPDQPATSNGDTTNLGAPFPHRGLFELRKANDEIDVAAIRADMERNQYAVKRMNDERLRLYHDKHEAEDDRDAALRQVEHYQAEIRELREAHAREMADTHARPPYMWDALLAYRDDARAKLEEIRALCDEEERDADTWAAMHDGGGVGRVAVDVDDLRAILDRPPHQGAERAEPQA